jgi:membrane dipeptidase
MDRRNFFRTGILGALAVAGAPMVNLGRCRLYAASAVEVSTRAVDLVLGSTVVDMLGLLTLDWSQLARWRKQPEQFVETDYRQLEASGVNVFHPAVETSTADAFEGAARWIGGWNRLLGAHPCFLQRVDTLTDLVHVPALGKVGVVVGFQNSTHFRTAGDVGLFFRHGQRVSQLTYNAANRLGSGAYAAKDHGLTRYGAEIVAEMNRVGMAIDVSHCGDRTSAEAVETSRRPVLITHSNCRALNPGHPRCKPDSVIRRVARHGGVMGITVVRAFVGRKRAPDLADLLDHFDHVARVAGAEHVGLGSDTDLTAIVPGTGRANPVYAIRGLDPRIRVFQIVDGLLRRGWADGDLRLMLGGNFLRALASTLPDDPRQPLRSEETLRRDPFCPAPRPQGPIPNRP